MNVILNTPEFNTWFDDLKDRMAKVRIAARIERAKNGNFGHYRVLGDGVCEMKIDVGKGYRVYYAQKGDVIYILLNGGDKSTQDSDIQQAKTIWKQIQQEQQDETNGI